MILVSLPARVMGAMSAIFQILYATSAIAADQAAQPPVVAHGFSSMLQVMFGLGLVLAAIAGTAWLLRRFTPGQVAGSGAIRVVGGVAVGPKERVVLVDVGDVRLVLGVAPGQVSTLLEMPRPVDGNNSVDVGNSSGKFYARLKEAMRSNAKSADSESEKHDAH